MGETVWMTKKYSVKYRVVFFSTIPQSLGILLKKFSLVIGNLLETLFSFLALIPS